jgi:hypothetical protein
MRFAGSRLLLLPVMLISSIAMSQTRTDVKPEDAVRIGIASPRITLIGGSGSVLNEATSLRQTVSGFLTGPRIGTVALKARLDSLALEEGQERQCDFVLYTTLSRKRLQTGPGSGGSFSTTKAQEEITFEYKLVSAEGSQPVSSNTTTTVVKFDGEDVLTPMIESAAQAIVTIARKARPAQAPSAANSVETPGGEVNRPPVQPGAPESTKRVPTGYDLMTAPPSTSNTKTNAVVNDPPKSEGATRIGIVIPRTNFAGAGSRRKEASALSESFKSYFAGSTIETIDLSARLDSLALDEARKRQCDYVLYTSLTQKRQGSGSKSSGPISGIVDSLGGSGMGAKIPGGKTAQTVSSGAASVAGTLSSLNRAKDEIIFEYRLVKPEGALPVLANTTKAKVKSDGQDVLTPMIENAAQAIVDVTRKN